MQGTNYLKLAWIAGFVIFAGVSCWATAESLHLLLSSWPKLAVYFVTIGFFIIASIGTKLIVDSLNTSVFIEKRGMRLFGGIILLLVFWLLFSMPTNTHTFFYRTAISDLVNNDISTTKGYLSQIQNNSHNKKQAEDKVKDLKNKVDALLGELGAEIMNEANPGFGPKAKEILRRFADLLGVDKIDPLSYKGTSKQDRERLCDAYRTKIYMMAQSKTDNIIKNIENPSPNLINDAKRDIKNLDLAKKYMNEGRLDINDADDVKNVCEQLNTGYNTIKIGKDFVNFSSEQDEKLYTATNPVTRVTRMLSVFHVWGDYLKGMFSGYGFIYWIMISILVDIAAFIFFDLAFRKTDD
ncbi:MAG: hypothetical protein IKH52_02370 [Bacteroidaceae bacterium]|nr:hypothetical protein [Bacteroidaceae bacterium]